MRRRSDEQGLARGRARDTVVVARRDVKRTPWDYSIKADAEAFILRLEDDVGQAVDFILPAEHLGSPIERADDLLETDDAETD